MLFQYLFKLFMRKPKATVVFAASEEVRRAARTFRYPQDLDKLPEDVSADNPVTLVFDPEAMGKEIESLYDKAGLGPVLPLPGGKETLQKLREHNRLPPIMEAKESLFQEANTKTPKTTPIEVASLLEHASIWDLVIEIAKRDCACDELLDNVRKYSKVNDMTEYDRERCDFYFSKIRG